VLAEWYEKEILAKGYTRKSSTPVTESLFNEYTKADAKMIMTVLGQKDDSGKWAVSVQISREEIGGNE
jgi:hypothetical protein